MWGFYYKFYYKKLALFNIYAKIIQIVLKGRGQSWQNCEHWKPNKIYILNKNYMKNITTKTYNFLLISGTVLTNGSGHFLKPLFRSILFINILFIKKYCAKKCSFHIFINHIENINIFHQNSSLCWCFFIICTMVVFFV